MPGNAVPWFVRPALWFAAAWMATTVVHEAAHAVTAYALGVRATLYNYAVDLDPTPAQAAGIEGLMIGVAGPCLNLVLGSLTWQVWRRRRDAAVSLPLLYLTVFSLATFFGNLMSAAYVGDFSRVAAAVGAPMNVRYTVAAIGGLGLVAIHGWAGRELARWIPPHVSRRAGALAIVLAPAAIGTAFVVLINAPMPVSAAVVRLTEASFWLCALPGAWLTRQRAVANPHRLTTRGMDLAVLIALGILVRGLMLGIPFDRQP